MPRQVKKQLDIIKQAYESSNDGWYDWYIQTGKIYVSKRWLEIIGIDQNDTMKNVSLWYNSVHPDDRDETIQLLNDHLDGSTDSYSSIHRLKHIDGHWVWVFDRGKVIERNKEGLPIRMTGFHSDVSVYRTLSNQLVDSKKELEYRVSFEEIINTISSGFINISTSRINSAIQESLGMVGKFMQVDRAYIFIIDHEQKTMSNCHEWCAEGVEPQKDNLFDIPLEAMPWWLDRMQNNESIVYPVVKDMPDEAAMERDTLLLQSIRSVIVVPMFKGDLLVGFVGYDAVKQARSWNATDEKLLRSLATTLMNVINLQQVQTELELLRSGLEQLVEDKTRELSEQASLLLAKDRELNTLWNAIHHSANGIVITDASRKIIYYNQAFCNFSGYNSSELIGKTPGILKSNKHNQDFYNDLYSTLNSRKTWKGQFINKRKDGSLYTEENVITPILDENGSIINYIAIKQDITLEQLLKTESERNEKLRALGTLAGGIAHDFNNILQIIQSYSELMSISIQEGNYNHSYFDQIAIATKKGKKLIDSILTFSSQENKPLEDKDITTLTIQTIETIRPLYTNRAVLTTRIEDCGIIPVNPLQFQQVLINLINNSADAVMDDNEINIQLERKKVKCESRNSEVEVVQLTVTDKGTGMTQETLERLYEPFFTTKPVGTGTGLGMPMVLGIVENHGGRIFVDSATGKGTTIRVNFPVSRDELCI